MIQCVGTEKGEENYHIGIYIWLTHKIRKGNNQATAAGNVGASADVSALQWHIASRIASANSLTDSCRL